MKNKDEILWNCEKVVPYSIRKVKSLKNRKIIPVIAEGMKNINNKIFQNSFSLILLIIFFLISIFPNNAPRNINKKDIIIII